MANETETRALGAALAAPAFVTRGTGVAMHAANRHVERWAPEAGAGRVRSMRSLGFVDRLVAPWMETAQRSASMRLFNQYAQSGASEREGNAVSWVFPRPWYQDELDWMAAARQSNAHAQIAQQAPTMLTTRGTYVAPSQQQAPSSMAAITAPMPAALYEFVAPSLSIATTSAGRPIQGIGFGGETERRAPTREAYSPLVSLAAVQAAELMSRTVAPLAAPHRGAGASTAMSPGLRSVLTSILARASVAEAEPTRLSMSAPELVTPPAPRPELRADAVASARGDVASSMMDAISSPSSASLVSSSSAAAAAAQVAEQVAAQRARVVELQRVAMLSAQREQAARLEAARAEVARSEAARGEAQRGEAARASSATEAARASSAAEAAATARGREVARDAALNQARAQAQTAAEQAAAAQSAEVRADAQRSEAELRTRAGAEAQRQAEAQRAGVEAQRMTEAQRIAEAQRQAIAQRAGSDAARAAEAAERARIEERIAQRMVQNQSAQRLHEQARADAAAHARAAEQGRADVASSTGAMPAMAAAPVPAEIAAAIAGLPPELQAMLGSTVSQRPERALQAISQLSDTLRTAELLARSSASGAAFEPTRGPRMTMPAGLGGLVHAVDRAQAMSSRPAMLGGVPMIAPLPQFVDARGAESAAMAQAQQRATQSAASAQARAARMPALSWLTAPTAQASAQGAMAGSPAPTSALGAVSSSSAPAALGHVAWADRWLARFAGASSQSLETMTASMGVAPEQRMQALAAVAPGAVFVAPDFLRGDLAGERAQQAAAAAAFAASGSYASPAATPSYASTPSYVPSARAESSVDAPAMRLINQPPSEPVLRFDDNAETPDDVFFAISAAASRGRQAPAAAASSSASSAASSAARPLSVAPGVATLAATTGPERHTFADLVAHAAPSAPGAGLSAQLASSPFAPALRHVMPLPSAASFDVRALFGSGLGATFLAGLVGGASRELEIGAQMTPSWASWAPAPIAALAGAAGAVEGDTDDRIDRLVPSFEATYLSGDAVMTPAQRAALAMQDRAFGTDAEAAVAAQAASSSADAAFAGATSTATSSTSASGTSADAVLAAAERASVPLTTLRTALLSWGLTISESGTGAPVLTPMTFTATPLAPAAVPTASATLAQSAPVARMMVDSLSLPLIGETAIDPAATWAAPGMLAERAQSWSAAQERSASDLALDFVPPELVLAARVYGLGPAEAAQAARLAVAGPGQLGAMASAVDRTFVDAMAIVRESRSIDGERRQRLLSDASEATQSFVAPTTATMSATARAEQAERIARELAAEAGAASSAAAAAGQATGAAPSDAQTIATAFPTADGVAAAVAPTARAPLASASAFGVDRRMPRGAFLWPQATVAALGMNAAGSDGQHTMSLAALELLAAQVVAEVGTYAALAEADAGARIAAGEARPDDVAGALGVAPGQALGATLGAAFSSAATTGASGGVAGIAGAMANATAGAMPMLTSSGSEPGETDVLGAAAALVPTARRARFDALYVALSQTPAGRSWSPAARAARALALVGRSDETTISARERATTAWDVLPVVYAGGDARDAAAESAEASAFGAPGAIAARAALSEAMASHVAPTWLRIAGRGPAAAGSFAGNARVAPDGREVVAPEFDGVHVGSGGAGLNGLSARAGEALGSYVTPVAAPSAPTSGRHSDMSSAGAMLRAPTAAPEYVNTRSTGRYGGGEVEIPSWFEAAARKMLSERSDNADGISLAELTLVTSAPAAQIAASTRSAPSATPPAPSTGSAAAQSNNAPQIDVEKLANEVYQSILVMMDIARARNGDPYL